MTGDYDYLNARIRGMSTELMSTETYEQVLAAEGEGLLMDVLLASAYGGELREALTVSQGLAAMESALRRNLHATFAKVLAMAPPSPREILTIQINVWDAANVLALVRGKVKGVEPEDIMEGVLPVGEFSEPQIEELARTPDVEALADALTTWNYRFAFELRRAILSAERRNLHAMEVAVGRVYFAWAMNQLASGDPDAAIVRGQINRQIDLVNVRMALERVRLRMRSLPVEAYAPIPAGLLALGTLKALSAASSLVEAFELLADTYFAPGIDRGILAFGRAQSLGAMERSLEVVVMNEGCRLFRRDPLSAAVPLGYLWRKYSEFLNLRIMLRGKSYRMPPNAIRKEMLIA